LTPSGGIAGVEVLRMAGDGNVESVVQQAIMSMGTFSEAPPEDLPKMVVVRINSAGNGA
jgi:hypothetical protein